MRVGTHQSAHFLLNQKFLSILMCYWLGLLLPKICTMVWAFQPLWENIFCNNLQSPDSAAKILGFGESQFASEVLNFVRLWWYSLGWNGLPKSSTCLTPKWLFSIFNFNPAWWKHLKTARMFRVKFVAFLAAIPMSSTYWANWSALTAGSKYSRMKLEKADTDLLRPCSSLL